MPHVATGRELHAVRVSCSTTSAKPSAVSLHARLQLYRPHHPARGTELAPLVLVPAPVFTAAVTAAFVAQVALKPAMATGYATLPVPAHVTPIASTASGTLMQAAFRAFLRTRDRAVHCRARWPLHSSVVVMAVASTAPAHASTSIVALPAPHLARPVPPVACQDFMVAPAPPCAQEARPHRAAPMGIATQARSAVGTVSATRGIRTVTAVECALEVSVIRAAATVPATWLWASALVIATTAHRAVLCNALALRHLLAQDMEPATTVILAAATVCATSVTRRATAAESVQVGSIPRAQVMAPATKTKLAHVNHLPLQATGPAPTARLAPPGGSPLPAASSALKSTTFSVRVMVIAIISSTATATPTPPGVSGLVHYATRVKAATTVPHVCPNAQVAVAMFAVAMERVLMGLQALEPAAAWPTLPLATGVAATAPIVVQHTMEHHASVSAPAALPRMPSRHVPGTAYATSASQASVPAHALRDGPPTPLALAPSAPVDTSVPLVRSAASVAT